MSELGSYTELDLRASARRGLLADTSHRSRALEFGPRLRTLRDDLTCAAGMSRASKD